MENQILYRVTAKYVPYILYNKIRHMLFFSDYETALKVYKVMYTHYETMLHDIPTVSLSKEVWYHDENDSYSHCGDSYNKNILLRHVEINDRTFKHLDHKNILINLAENPVIRNRFYRLLIAKNRLDNKCKYDLF